MNLWGQCSLVRAMKVSGIDGGKGRRILCNVPGECDLLKLRSYCTDSILSKACASTLEHLKATENLYLSGFIMPFYKTES